MVKLHNTTRKFMTMSVQEATKMLHVNQISAKSEQCPVRPILSSNPSSDIVAQYSFYYGSVKR